MRREQLARQRAQQQGPNRRVLTAGLIALLVTIVVVAGITLYINAHRTGSGTSAAPKTSSARTGALTTNPSAPTTVACGGTVPPAVTHPTFSKGPGDTVTAGTTYTATFKTSCGSFTVQLDPTTAPYTVSNFVFLAQHNFYNSTWFHRILPNGGANSLGIVQGGSPNGLGNGGPGYTIRDELPKTPNPYATGTLAMANTGAPHTGGSQFFFDTQNNSSVLPPQYTVFGHVTTGLSVLERIDKIPTTGGAGSGVPTQAAWIDSVTITTH